jgi:hypothetical protein
MRDTASTSVTKFTEWNKALKNTKRKPISPSADSLKKETENLRTSLITTPKGVG